MVGILLQSILAIKIVTSTQIYKMELPLIASLCYPFGHVHHKVPFQGWCGSADPRKRQYETKHSESEEIRKEIEEIKVKKDLEHKEITSGEGIELVPLMKDKYTGRPHKDPSTGYMMSHGLSSTDVTKLADKIGSLINLFQCVLTLYKILITEEEFFPRSIPMMTERDIQIH